MRNLCSIGLIAGLAGCLGPWNPDWDPSTDTGSETDTDTDTDTDTTPGEGTVLIGVGPLAKTGCACSAGSTSAGWFLWLGPLAALLLRRR